MVYSLWVNALFLAAAAGYVFFLRKSIKKSGRDQALEDSSRIVHSLALRMAAIGHRYGLARIPMPAVENEVIKEIQLLSADEVWEFTRVDREKGKGLPISRESLREQMLDDLLRSGCLKAVPDYIEPEKLLEMFRDIHRNPDFK